MIRRKLIFTLLLLLGLGAALDLIGASTPVTSAMAPSAIAYSLMWSTVDDGGGTSTGDAYTLSGTIGQPDAGASNGGAYSLGGGFWGTLAARVLQGVSIYLPLIRR
jgi:hypothetical protein